MTDVRYDEGTGIIHCSGGGGFWSVEAIQQSGDAILGVMQRCRREFGNIAMLVVTDAPLVQTAEVLEATKRRMQAWGPNDRMAIVMSSALVNLQANRFLASDKCRIFASENEAVAWLTLNRMARTSASPRVTVTPY